ncbi:MAG: tetratricopeptide repeat protein [Gammaproteobacteria bacterium]
MAKRNKRTIPAGATGRTSIAESVAKNLRGKVASVTVVILVAGLAAWFGIPRPTKSLTYTPRLPGTLTFNKDIAPIVFNRCAGCHRSGQAAPFSLLDYQDVKTRARRIVEVTSKRYMPPWLPEPGFGEFVNDRRLSVDQLGMIQQWVGEGTVEGNAADLPPTPKWTEGWQLGEPSLVVKMPQPFTLKPDGKDVYRNFVIPIPISATKFVQAVEFLPGLPKVVHHALILVDPTRESRRLDDQDPEPGFSFMITPAGAKMPEGQFLSWTPGSVPSVESEGLAWRLEKGTDLVLQMHMRPTGKPETIQSTVGFHFTDTATTNTPFKILLTSRAIDIPAGEKNYLVKDSFTLPVDASVLAVLPHAHYVAKEMQGWATLPDGTKKWLILIKNWDFNWQGDYQYAQPIFLAKGTTLSMQFTYDNSADNERNPHHPPRRVTFGPDTADEMGELWFQVLLRNRADLSTLARVFQTKSWTILLEHYQWLVRTTQNDPDAYNGLGKVFLGLGREAEAIGPFRTAVALRPDFEEPHFLLGYLYRKQKDFIGARTEYEQVIRINPINHEAQGNLGLVYLDQGQIEQAEIHFRSALRINPDDAVARRNLQVVLDAKSRSRLTP